MHVRADHMRLLLRLLGEASELRRAGHAPYRHFLAGLARISRAQIAIKMTASGVGPSGPPVVTEVYDHGWSTPSDRERVYDYVKSTPLAADPLAAAAFERGKAQVTLARADVISSTDWDASEVRNDVHRPSGIDDAILSLRRRDGEPFVDVLVLKRAWGDSPFGEDERELLDLVQGECAWLFAGASENDRDLDDRESSVAPERASDVVLRRELSPREGETLDLLLRGECPKAIASALGLSLHTVRQYVKSIYRKTGVSGRAELMAWALASVAPSRPSTVGAARSPRGSRS